MTSLIDATKPVTGSPTTESVRDNFATTKTEIEALQDSVAGLIGMGKNCLINPNFTVNQQAVSGTVTLAAGAYGHDRWKAGSLGCTYTFSSSNGIVTLNITAGSLQQVIEAGNIPVGSNACTLCWSGTAQGKIGGGAYTATKVTATVTGGSNLTVEFNTGTLALVQFEKGSVPTLFEQRNTVVELVLCKYYFEIIRSTAGQCVASGVAYNASSQLLLTYTAKRIPPVISMSTGWIVQVTASFAATFSSAATGISSAFLVVTHTSLGGPYPVVLVADATAGRTITINAEL